MLDMSATAWTPVVFLGQFKDSQRGAWGHIRGHPTRLGKFLLCLLVGAHLLEHRPVLRGSLNQGFAVLIKSFEQGILFLGINSPDILNISPHWLVETLARFEVRSARLIHSNIEQVSSRVHPGIKSSLCLINVALHFASYLECLPRLRELSNVKNSILLD